MFNEKLIDGSYTMSAPKIGIIGDSFTVLPRIPDKRFDAIITDVPYDLSVEQKQFLHSQFLRIAKSCVIVFSPPENQWILPADQFMFWIKPISTKNTSKNYSRFVEMMFLYKLPKYVWNIGRHWSQYTNVFTDLVDDASIHPYRKPPSLLDRLIRNHTNSGDVVLDPFFGSGSIGDACNRLGRYFVGIEQSDEYTQYWNVEKLIKP